MGAIVFTGSSSIFFWETLSENMKPLNAINRGFGGSHLSHVNKYATRIVIQYRPRAVVLYAGENDMSWPWSKSSDTVLKDLQQFVKVIHTAPARCLDLLRVDEDRSGALGQLASTR